MTFHLYHLVCVGGGALMLGICIGIKLVYGEIAYRDSLTPCERCQDKEKDQ